LICPQLRAVDSGPSESRRIQELERDVAELNYYIHGDDIKLMVNYIHTWSDFRAAHPEFGEDQFDELIGRIQVMF
jgi:hypothetical protein